MIKNILIVFALTISNASSLEINVKSKELSVSGISSGAFFAHQFHIAFNKRVTGSALFAGGPFNCANGSVSNALGRCMKGEGSFDLAEKSIETIKQLSKKNKVDKISNTKDDRVFVFSGMRDSVVAQAVSYQVKRLYNLLGLKNENIKYIDDMKAGHTYPTKRFGNPCETPKKSPFISSCRYDGALESLTFLYPDTQPIAPTQGGKLLKVSQKKYFKFASKPLMQDDAYLYIPQFCESNDCDFHVAFHGCAQTVDHIEKLFVTKTGILSAADKLNLVVLFPQAKKTMFMGKNPHGCWDWWGHSSSEYHTKKGDQMLIVSKMITDLTGIIF